MGDTDNNSTGNSEHEDEPVMPSGSKETVSVSESQLLNTVPCNADLLEEYFSLGKITIDQARTTEELLKCSYVRSYLALSDDVGTFLERILARKNACEYFAPISRALDKKGLVSRLLKNHITSIIGSAVTPIVQFQRAEIVLPDNTLKIIIRVALQLIQTQYHNSIPRRIDDSSLRVLLIYLKTVLLQLIAQQTCSFECVFLAGTCVVHIMHLCMTVETFVNSYLNLIHNKRPIDETDLTPVYDETQLLSVNLALINGLLNSNVWEVLLHTAGDEMLLLHIYPIIYDLLECPAHVYQAFRVLLCWLRTFHKFYLNFADDNSVSFHFSPQRTITLSRPNAAGTEENRSRKMTMHFVNPVFLSSSDVFVSVVNVLIVNWENFTQGVPGLVTECFDLLLTLHEIESVLFYYDDNTISELMTDEMQLSWTTKRKYPALAVLIQHYGVGKFAFFRLLKEYPTFPMDLTMSLTSNSLASAGTDVYRNSLQLMLANPGSVGDWLDIWLEPFTCCVKQNEMTLQNVLRHWLPCTLKILPDVLHFLLLNFTCYNIPNQRVTRVQNNYKLASISIIRCARSMGLMTFSEMKSYYQGTFVEECLNHTDDRVRIEAFAAVCTSNKKADPLSADEISLMASFLALNLNVDSAPFRQQLGTNLRPLLIRVRDSSIGCLASSEEEKGQMLDRNLKFVDDLYKLALRNLFPGASYQRRRTCLDIVVVILEVFKAETNVGKRKGKVPVKTPSLVAHAQANGLWSFLDSNVFDVLLCCVQDFMSEIKELAVKILDTYFEWNDEFILTQKGNLESHAYQWMRSPKPHVCESGALLYQLVVKKLVLNTKDDGSALKECLERLLAEAKTHFSAVEKDIFTASKSFPLHGVIATLKLLMNEITLSNKEALHDLEEPISQTIKLVRNIIDHFLNFLSHKSVSAKNSNASFADMGEAIEEILNGSEGGGEYHNCNLSPDFQLVSSCCWINLRECSYLLAKMVKLSVNSDETCNKTLLKTGDVQQAGNEIVNVMMKCRHKGVIEACCLALGEYCQSLLSSERSDYRNIPFELLKDALVCIKTSSRSSTTRRSAGIPLLICAILTQEPSNRCRPLLSFAMDSLLRMVALPLPEDHGETSDLPQVHALHSMKSLVHDARLAQSMQPFIVSLVELCVQNFDSKSWAVRNACLQLFGSLVLRLLGQKKVRDDDSLHNSVTAESFFYQHVALIPSLLNVLQDAVSNKTCCRPGLIPVLSVLCRLAPSHQSIETNSTLKSFSEKLLKLLDHSSIAVRKLAVESSFVLGSYHNVTLTSQLTKLTLPCDVSTNFVHGQLLLVKKLASNDVGIGGVDLLEKVVRNCQWLIDHKSFVIRTLFLECMELMSHLPRINSVWMEMYNEKHESGAITFSSNAEETWLPGNAEWIKSSIDKFFPITKKLENVLTNFESGNQDEIQGCLNCLNQIVDAREYALLFDSLELQQNLMKFVLGCSNLNYVSATLDLIIKLISKCSEYHPILTQQTTVAHVQNVMKSERGVSAAASAMAFLGHAIKIMSAKKEHSVGDKTFHDFLNTWISCVHEYSTPSHTEDLRIQSAEALCVPNPVVLITLCEEAATFNKRFKLLHSLFAAITNLLTDENADVRLAATRFTSMLPTQGFPYYQFPDISTNLGIPLLIAYLMNKVQINLIFSVLWDHIGEFEPETLRKCTQEKNLVLFDQEDVNIYAEECELARLCTETLTAAIPCTDKISEDIKTMFKQESGRSLRNSIRVARYLVHEKGSHGSWCLSNVMQSKAYLSIYRFCCRVKILIEIAKKVETESDMQNQLQQILDTLSESGFDIFGFFKLSTAVET